MRYLCSGTAQVGEEPAKKKTSKEEVSKQRRKCVQATEVRETKPTIFIRIKNKFGGQNRCNHDGLAIVRESAKK